MFVTPVFAIGRVAQCHSTVAIFPLRADHHPVTGLLRCQHFRITEVFRKSSWRFQHDALFGKVLSVRTGSKALTAAADAAGLVVSSVKQMQLLVNDLCTAGVDPVALIRLFRFQDAAFKDPMK